jgi:hypothetical protein
MLRFLMAGGWPIWWLLILGLPLLTLAAGYMFRPAAHRVAVIRSLTAAVAFASLAGMASGLIAVAWTTTSVEALRSSPDFSRIVIVGIGEALTPVALGFTLLSLVWLFVAVGSRRAQASIE